MGIKLDLSDDEHRTLQAEARLVQKRRSGSKLHARHPWPFLCDAIYTLDQARNRIEKLPTDMRDPHHPCDCGGCDNYLHHLVNTWFREKRFAVPKSRRMIVTWTMLACHYWLARFHPGTAIAIQSRKLGDNLAQGSWELIERIKFMELHLPPEVAPVPCVMPKGPLIRWPTINSHIMGIAQGANQLRQLTLTAILADEMAFWEEGQESYVASLPTLEGGGRFTAVSSAHPGFFKQMVYDEMNAATYQA